MTRHNYRAWIAATLFGFGLTGCQQELARNAPGALPTPKAEDLTPKNVNATTLFAHGHLLERQGEFDRAMMQYQRALELKPDFVTARNRLGITLNKVGKHDEATAQFRQAIEAQPNSAYLLNNLGFSLYLQGQHAESLGILKRAVEISPDFSRARMNYAVALAKTGQYDLAFQELTKVGSEADANYNVGMLLTEGGRYAEAAQRFEAALSFNPKLEAARTQLREVARLAAGLPARQTTALASASEPQMLSALPPADPVVIEPTSATPAAAPSHTPSTGLDNTSNNTITPSDAAAFWGSTPADSTSSPLQAAGTPAATSAYDESGVDPRYIEMAPDPAPSQPGVTEPSATSAIQTLNNGDRASPEASEVSPPETFETIDDLDLGFWDEPLSNENDCAPLQAGLAGAAPDSAQAGLNAAPLALDEHKLVFTMASDADAAATPTAAPDRSAAPAGTDQAAPTDQLSPPTPATPPTAQDTWRRMISGRNAWWWILPPTPPSNEIK